MVVGLPSARLSDWCQACAAGPAFQSSTTRSASLPGVKLPTYVIDVEPLRPALRDRPEGAIGRQLVALGLGQVVLDDRSTCVQHADLVGVVQDAEHREAIAAADVGAERQPDALRRDRWRDRGGTGRCRGTSSSNGQKVIAAAAGERRRNSSSLSQIAVAAREFRADQAVLLVDRNIVGAVGIELANVLALTERLGQVRVDPAVGVLAASGARRRPSARGVADDVRCAA